MLRLLLSVSLRLHVAGLFACLSVACAAAPPLSRTPDPRDLPRTEPVEVGVPDGKLWGDAVAVFEKRCVVCHGCYDAPCQLKLETFAGLARGANKQPVYAPSRLTAAEPTRLFVDAQLVSEWRHKGFHAVLPDATQPDPQRSVLARMLELKQSHPLTAGTPLGEAFTWGLDREQTCPDAQHFDEYAEQHPLWGMPYALPNLPEPEYAALRAWLTAGAPAAPIIQEGPEHLKQIAIWETYFNEQTPKRKLTARYLYEHLFLASLYFPGVDDDALYRLVRSRTPSGFAVDEIATRRPFEDPGTGELYYRLVRIEGPRLSKTHMPYALDDARLARYRTLFDEPDYSVNVQPSYDPAVAANPLTAFAALPVRSRYRFLLDDAQFTLMNFIKGPVCRGQVALNVIQERFWVTFVDPEAEITERQAELLREVRSDLELPAEAGSNAWPTRWFLYANQHAKYVAKRNELVGSLARTGPGLSVDMLWNGGGDNRNAALTVFRHFDSATVVSGLVGGVPQTAWVIDYPMFERIHYLLVAGFDVFGNVGHQILTRLYMDFLRMEGEANFLALLPRARRKQLAHAWYRGVKGEAAKRVNNELLGLGQEPRMRYTTAKPELELYAAMEKRLSAVRSERYVLSSADPNAEGLRGLEKVPGRAASILPETSFVAVDGPERVRFYSVLRDSAHTNVAELFDEDDRRLPDEDVLRVVPGFLGAYPNALFRVDAAELPAFVEQVSSLDGAERYRALHARFGVSRASSEFWTYLDAMHAEQRKSGPRDAGLFDLNRLQAD